MRTSEDLLFEIGCEELPPKSLNTMAEALLEGVVAQLTRMNIPFNASYHYASPRRLAMIITGLARKQPDTREQRLGPNVIAAFDQQGNYTKAAIGFARSCGVDPDQLQQIDTEKGKRLGYVFEHQGQTTAALLPEIIEQSLKKLPISKYMRWGDHDYAFVRPVHWMVGLFGHEVLNLSLFGVTAGKITYGHRFLSPEAIELEYPGDYVERLYNQGSVIVDTYQRKQMIRQQVEELAAKHHLKAVMDEALLEEVSAIIEWPDALLCNFDESFLRVPKEALITAMQSHQKSFSLLDDQKKLVNKFITISNIVSPDPKVIVHGNEKVMSARLADAAFFYDADVSIPLEQFTRKLDRIVFEKQLGTLSDKAKRVSQLAAYIARINGADINLVKRSAELAKADLMTDMVFEFPELQGLMGYYYAIAQQEPKEVAIALYQQYLPRFSGDDLPDCDVSTCLSLADKLDTVVGIFGINQKPTGDKDPYALRRCMIGVLRILKSTNLHINFDALLTYAKSLYEIKLNNTTVEQVYHFALDRLKGIYREQGIEADVFEAVKAVRPQSIDDFDARINAVLAFKQNEQAGDLAQSNKRIINILNKNTISNDQQPQASLLKEPAEIQLYDQLNHIQQGFTQALEQHRYVDALHLLADLHQPINAFFDHVMVNAEDAALRSNRLALLGQIHDRFIRIADVSLLVFD